MRRLRDLSREELLSYIYNTYKDTDISTELAECAACGSNKDARYFFVCDHCNELFEEEYVYVIMHDVYNEFDEVECIFINKELAEEHLSTLKNNDIEGYSMEVHRIHRNLKKE